MYYYHVSLFRFLKLEIIFKVKNSEIYVQTFWVTEDMTKVRTNGCVLTAPDQSLSKGSSLNALAIRQRISQYEKRVTNVSV